MKSGKWEKIAETDIYTEVRERDKVCRICGDKPEKQNLHVHHIVSRRRGGTDNLENLVALCSKCHPTVERITETLINRGCFQGADSWKEIAETTKQQQMLSKHEIIKRYIPDKKRWDRIVNSHFSTSSAGEAEAVKQMLESHFEDLFFDDMPTWYWHTEQIEEVLSMPDVDNLETESLILPEGIGVGFHLFRKINEGKVADRLHLSKNFFPFAIIITPQREVLGIYPNPVEENIPDNKQVVIAEALEKDILRLVAPAVPAHHPWFFIAAKMTAFLEQKLVDVLSEKALKRPDRKRIGMDLPVSQTEVNVVTWRKIKDQPGTGKSEWDKRWWVRMHWRKQWYPSKNAHRLICIAPFVKGNPNMPLHIPKPTVNKVDR